MTTDSPSSAMLNGFLKLVSKLPLSLLQSFARLIARFFIYNKKNNLQKTIHRNLLIAFPEWNEQQRQQVTEQALQAQLLSMVEFLKCWTNPPAYSINSIKEVYGEQLFNNALAKKNGLIIIVPHFGSWEIMNAWISQFTDMVVMYKPDSNTILNQFVLDARSSLNATLVPADDSGVRQVFKTLKKGGVTAILPDHTPEQSGGIYSPFFDCPVLTATLVSKLAQKTQCDILQFSCLRTADQHGFTIQIETVNPLIHSEHLQVSVDTLNAGIEALIRQNPQHYHWGYKRFKSHPILGGIYYVDEEEVPKLIQQAQIATATPTSTE